MSINQEGSKKPSNSAHFADFARAQFNNVVTLNEEEQNRINSPLINKYVYDNLPEPLITCCSIFNTPREKDVFLTGAITVLSGCFSTVYGVYDSREVNSNLFCFVVAPAASGKGVMGFAKILGSGIHNRLIDGNEVSIKQYRDEIASYNAKMKNSNDKIVITEAPIEPETKLLYIPANGSAAALFRHLHQNNGCGIMFESEADTLSGALKQDFGGFSDLLRKSFHQETFSYTRKANNLFVEIPRPNLSVALSGTPLQVGRLLVNPEDGLFSRFSFYYFDTPTIWHDVSPVSNANFDDFFQDFAEQIYEIHIALKDQRMEFELTQSQWHSLNDFMDGNLKESDADIKSSVIRTGTIIFKIAMTLTVLRNAGNFSHDMIICSDTDFKIALLLGKTHLMHAELVYKNLLIPKHNISDVIRSKFLNVLPGNTPFGRKEAVLWGKDLDISERQTDNYLKYFLETGKLQLQKYGIYIKN